MTNIAIWLLCVVVLVGTVVAVFRGWKMLALLGYGATVLGLGVLPQLGAMRAPTYAKAKLLDVVQPYYRLVDHLTDLADRGDVQQLRTAIDMLDTTRDPILHAYEDRSFGAAVERVILKTNNSRVSSNDAANKAVEGTGAHDSARPSP